MVLPVACLAQGPWHSAPTLGRRSAGDCAFPYVILGAGPILQAAKMIVKHCGSFPGADLPLRLRQIA